jgi:hypothetical protein
MTANLELGVDRILVSGLEGANRFLGFRDILLDLGQSFPVVDLVHEFSTQSQYCIFSRRRSIPSNDLALPEIADLVGTVAEIGEHFIVVGAEA